MTDLEESLLRAIEKDASRAQFIRWSIWATVVGIPFWLIAIYIELVKISALLERSAQ